MKNISNKVEAIEEVHQDVFLQNFVLQIIESSEQIQSINCLIYISIYI